MALDMTKQLKLGEVFDSMNRDEDFCVGNIIDIRQSNIYGNIDFNNASSDDNMDGAGQLEVTRTEE